MHSEQHLLNELNELKKDYDYKKKLLGGYRQQLRILRKEDVEAKLSLNYQIKQAKDELDKLDLQIDSLDKKIASINKPSQTDSDDDFYVGEQEKIQIWVNLDNFSFQLKPDGNDGEKTKNKAHISLQKLRSTQKKDFRVPDGLKDENRKIYKKGKYGEQLLLKDDDRIFDGDILESRPDAIKG